MFLKVYCDDSMGNECTKAGVEARRPVKGFYYSPGRK